MSFNDPAETPDVVQPEGQGDGGTAGDSPYSEYLNRIPEDARDMVAPVFKDWDANVTRKFQEHSEFRKQWEPFQETGINQLTPEQASWAAQFMEAMQNPETIKEWYEQSFAPEHGFTAQQAAEVAEQVDDFGFQDPSQQIEKLLEEKLGPLSKQMEQFTSWRDQQEQARSMDEAKQFIDGQINALQEKHGEFDELTREMINTQAGKYIESDPMNAIPRAYEDLQRWRNDIEKSTLQAKVNQPAPAESGGVPDVNPPEYKRIDDAAVKNAALEMLRSQNRA